MIALSILHGGPGPVFFSPVVIDYLFGGISAVKPSFEDVLEEELQSKIRKVHTRKYYAFLVLINCDE